MKTFSFLHVTLHPSFQEFYDLWIPPFDNRRHLNQGLVDTEMFGMVSCGRSQQICPHVSVKL